MPTPRSHRPSSSTPPGPRAVSSTQGERVGGPSAARPAPPRRPDRQLRLEGAAMARKRRVNARPVVALLALATGVGIAIGRVRAGGRERRTGMQANKDLAKRVLTEVFNEGRLDTIDE